MPAQSGVRRVPLALLALAGIIVLTGTVGLAAHLAAVLSDSVLAQEIISAGLWQDLVAPLGAPISARREGASADVPFAPVLAATAAFSLLTWLAGAGWISRRREIPFTAALCLWGSRGWLWWLRQRW